MLRTPLILLSIFSLAFFTACNDTPAPAPIPTLEVSPLQISALAGDAATALEAKVSNSNAAVLWTLEGAGTLSSLKGEVTKYTPPAELNTASSAKITVVLEGTKLSQLINIALTPKPTTYLPTVGTTVDLTQPTYAGSSKIRFTASLAPLGPTPFKKPARVSGSSTASMDQIEWKLTGPGKLDPVKGEFTDYTPPDEVLTKTQVTVAAQYQGRISTLNFFVTPKPVQPAPKLTISPSSATFTAGDAGQSFSATLENSSETINWILDGVGTLSSTTGKTVIYTPPSSVTKEETVKLTARAGQVSTLSTLTIKPGVRITGLVTQGTYAIQEPEVGVEVGELGQPLVKSSADGTFAFTVSKLPYNLMVIKSNQYGKGADIFYGVSTKQIRIYDDKLGIEDKFQNSLTTINFSTEPDIVNSYPTSYDSTTARVLVTNPQGKTYTLYSSGTDGKYEKKMLCSTGPMCSGKVIIQRYRKEGNVVTAQIGETDDFTIPPGKVIDLGKIILKSFDTKKYAVKVEFSDRKLYSEYSSVFLSKTMSLLDLNYYGKIYQEGDDFTVYIPNLDWKIKYFRPYIYSGNLTFGAQKNSSLLLKTNAFLSSIISVPNTFLPSPEISSTPLGGVLDVRKPVVFNSSTNDQIRQFWYSGKR